MWETTTFIIARFSKRTLPSSTRTKFGVYEGWVFVTKKPSIDSPKTLMIRRSQYRAGFEVGLWKVWGCRVSHSPLTVLTTIWQFYLVTDTDNQAGMQAKPYQSGPPPVHPSFSLPTWHFSKAHSKNRCHVGGAPIPSVWSDEVYCIPACSSFNLTNA